MKLKQNVFFNSFKLDNTTFVFYINKMFLVFIIKYKTTINDNK